MIECSFYVSTNIVTFAKKDCKSSVNNQTASDLVEVLLIFNMENLKILTKSSQMKKLYVPADKTTNLYKVSVDEYEKLLDKNIQNDYKKSTITDAK